MSVAFSSDGSEAIHRNVSVEDPDQPDDYYDTFLLRECAEWISSNNYQRIALQFPDELLSVSVQICRTLQQNVNAFVFILADTAYGSCCVDEVAAEHHNADSLVHFGQACLSPTARLPVYYIFGQQNLDVPSCSEALKSTIPGCGQPVLVLTDVVYNHKIDAVVQTLRETFAKVIGSKLLIPKTEPRNCDSNKACCKQSSSDEVLQKSEEIQKKTPTDSVENNEGKHAVYGRTFELDGVTLTDLIVVYIGSEGAAMTNWILHFKDCEFFSYDPRKNIARKETVNVNKYLMKRYYLVEKAKDAQIVGVLVGTLGVHHYIDALDRLKVLIKKAGKKSYTFVVGKVNVPKLANFMEIDIYVLVACPLNSLLDSSDFYRPVITPYEFELACNPSRSWTGQLVLDFNQLLPGGSDYVEEPERYEERTDISLVTGSTRRLGLSEMDPSTGQLMTQEKSLAALPSAGAVLAERSWTGLEQRLGKTPVTKATKGRKGIAIGYEEEPSNKEH